MSEDLITDEMVEAGARAIAVAVPCPDFDYCSTHKWCTCKRDARLSIEAALRARNASAVKTEA